MVTITEAARKKILGLLEAEEQKNVGVGMGVRGGGAGGFRYEMQFVGQDERGTEDTVVDVGDFQVLVDPESAPNLKGATVDFVDGAYESGFKIENPNPLWTDPKAQAVQDIIDKQVNPGVAMHGGNVSLLDLKDNITYIQ